MNKIFGKSKKKDKVPSTEEAIQKLRATEEILQKKVDFLEKKCESETQNAKKNAGKNKRLALQALKRRKRHEAQLQKLDGTLTTIESQRETLENASTHANVLEVLSFAGSALKNTMKIDVDTVHEMMDDIAEQHDVYNEVTEAISQGWGPQVDEDELLAELEELEQDDVTAQLSDVRDMPSLPAVPADTDTTSTAKTEHEALANLAAWAT